MQTMMARAKALTPSEGYFVLGDAKGRLLSTDNKLLSRQEAEELPSEVWRFFTERSAERELSEQVHGQGRELRILRKR